MEASVLISSEPFDWDGPWLPVSPSDPGKSFLGTAVQFCARQFDLNSKFSFFRCSNSVFSTKSCCEINLSVIAHICSEFQKETTKNRTFLCYCNRFYHRMQLLVSFSVDNHWFLRSPNIVFFPLFLWEPVSQLLWEGRCSWIYKQTWLEIKILRMNAFKEHMFSKCPVYFSWMT